MDGQVEWRAFSRIIYMVFHTSKRILETNSAFVKAEILSQTKTSLAGWLFDRSGFLASPNSSLYQVLCQADGTGACPKGTLRRDIPAAKLVS
jgi:hypothetical protein